MQKFISFILALVLFSFNVFAQSDNVSAGEYNNVDYNETISVLTSLGAFSTDDKGNVPEQPVTRGGFVEHLGKALKLDAFSEPRRIFSDVPLENREAGYITTLVDLNCISISSDRKFNPENYITRDEALKILISLSGYGDYAIALGGYPFGYSEVARKLEIYANTKSSEQILTSEVANMIYDAITVGICDASSITPSGYTTFSVNKQETLLSAYRNIYIQGGEVGSLYANTCTGVIVSEKNDIIVGDKLYSFDSSKYNLTEMIKYLGVNAKIVYEKYHESRTEGKIIYIRKLNESYEEINIKSDSIEEFDNSSYSLYYMDDSGKKRKKISIPSDITVIYNGKYDNTAFSDIIDEFITGEKKGSIALKGYKNNKYTYAIIESFETIIVGKINLADKIIYDKVRNWKIIDLTKYKNVYLSDLNGNEISENTIAAPSVLNIAESRDKEFIRAVLCYDGLYKTITGTVNSINVDEKELGIDDKTISVDNYSWEFSNLKDLKLGTECTIYIDMFEDAVYAGSTQENFEIGYLIKCGYNNKGLKNNLQLKIMDSTGKINIFDMADNIEIDGRKYKSFLKAVASIPGTTGVTDPDNELSKYNKPKVDGQVIRYMLDSNGYIKKIDTVEYNKDSEIKEKTLSRVATNSKKRAVKSTILSGTRKIGSDILIDTSTTLMFAVPYLDSDGTCLTDSNRYGEQIVSAPLLSYTGEYVEATDLMYRLNPELLVDSYYIAESYQCDTTNPFSDITVIYQTGQTTIMDPMMIAEISHVLDEDGNEFINIKTLVSGVSRDYKFPTDFDISNLHVGDIIRVYVDNSSNLVGTVVKIFDCATMSFVESTSPYSYGNSSWGLSKGFAVMSNERGIKTKQTMPDNEYDFDMVEVLPKTIPVYDKTRYKEKAYLGSYNDIVDYAMGGENCSVVIFPSRNGYVYTPFIYN